ncbi:MAG: TonB-dependent receptor [Saprospiraceae bacterium]
MSYKYVLNLLLLVFSSNYCLSQITINGKIVDQKTKENLIGASIYLSDLKKGASSDLEGNFSIKNIRAGKIFAEISNVGYKSLILQLNIRRDTFLTIALSESVAELNEVVVTAVTRSTEIKNSPVIIKAIDKNAISQTTSSNLIDALKNVPGISQITTGASISKPIIRGMGFNRVITLYNGIRQEGQQWGDEHGIEVDEYDIDRIEIVKGPGSMMYGSDGIAGVLNFLSPKTIEAGKINSQFTSNYQSNNQFIGNSFTNAGNRGGIQWRARISNKMASNYENKFDKKVYNSGFKELNGSLFAGVNKNWGHTHFNFSTYNTTINLPEGERDSSGNFTFINTAGNEQVADEKNLKGYQTGFPHQKVNHLRFSNNTYILLQKGTLNVDLAYQRNQRIEFADVLEPDSPELYFDLNTVNYNARYNLFERNLWETSFGISGMLQNNSNKGAEFLIPAYNLFDVGVFAFTQKTFFNKLTLAGGIRADNRFVSSSQLYLDQEDAPISIPDTSSTLKFNALKDNYYGFSGSLGLAYQIDKVSTLKFNLSRGFRAPTIAELASNGKHEGAFRYEIGNPSLSAETSHQIDLAYFLNAEHFTFEITPFVNFISNYIFTQKMKDAAGNDIIPDPSDPAPAFRFVHGNARLWGAEFFMDLHPHPFDWLHIENSFSFVRANQPNQSDSTRNLPFIPQAKYSGVLKAQFINTGKILNNTYARIGIDHFFKQDLIYSAYDTETTTPGYTLINAGIGCNVRAFKRSDFVTVIINGENIGNTTFQNHLSRLKYGPLNLQTGRSGIFNMGRNFSVKTIFNF